MEPQEFNYFLISGTVHWHKTNEEDPENTTVGTRSLNAIFSKEIDDGMEFPLDHLVNCQQALHNKFQHLIEEDPSFQTSEVTINSITYLGQMTEEKFQGKENLIKT